MANPNHRTPEHRAARKRYAAVIKAGQGWCAEPVCLMASRFIPPDTPWDVSHDPSGTVTIGPSHRACNRSEGARRGNRMRRRRPRERWVM